MLRHLHELTAELGKFEGVDQLEFLELCKKNFGKFMESGHSVDVAAFTVSATNIDATRTHTLV